MHSASAMAEPAMGAAALSMEAVVVPARDWMREEAAVVALGGMMEVQAALEDREVLEDLEVIEKEALVDLEELMMEVLEDRRVLVQLD